MSYVFVGGFRLVVPYLFTIRRGVKLAWMGRKLEQVVSEYFRFLSCSEGEGLQSVFDDGRVTVDGRLVGSNYILSANEVVELLIHMHEPEVLDRPIRLLHIDDDVVVVNKPSSIPIHPIGTYKFNTIERILAHERPELKEYLTAVHRIDRQTSGLLLLARNRRTAARLSDQFMNRSLRKEYLARVKGEFPEGKVEVDQPIIQKTFSPPILYGVSSGGRRAVTVFDRESVAADGSESIVRCRPITGRSHQIRVHLQWLGNPISNDFKYGGDLNVNEVTYNSSVPKVRGYSKVKWCSECSASDLELARSVPLADSSYSIWLHSFSYTSEDAGNPWTFEAPRPPWTDLHTC